MSFVPSRRQHARFACTLSLLAIASGVRGPLEGTMLNVGMGGAFVKVKGALPGGSCTLRITLGEETISLGARVVRISSDPVERLAGHYGLEFSTDSDTRQRVRLLVDRVRSQRA